MIKYKLEKVNTCLKINLMSRVAEGFQCELIKIQFMSKPFYSFALELFGSAVMLQ
jgi:hypothetical protein